jgi:hypothetical protein
MSNKNLTLTALAGSYSVCRLGPSATIPGWVPGGGFVSVTRTADELSIVCPAGNVPSGVRAETGWRVLQVQGPLDFALTGILAALATTLAGAGISLFAISTYDTDFILVKDLVGAVKALRLAGHVVTGE